MHRFAGQTSSALKSCLPRTLNLEVLSHTWSTDDDVSAPWLKSRDLMVASPTRFVEIWPQSQLLVEPFDHELPSSVEKPDSDQFGYSGFESRASTYRMLCSISRVCELALARADVESDMFILTRTDFLAFDPLPLDLSSLNTGSVFFPNLRRNGGFCDWFLILDSSGIESLILGAEKFTEVSSAIKSFAGEDILASLLDSRGKKVSRYRWSGMLMRDPILDDSRFGKFPRRTPYLRRWASQVTSAKMQNLFDFVYKLVRS